MLLGEEHLLTEGPITLDVIPGVDESVVGTRAVYDCDLITEDGVTVTPRGCIDAIKRLDECASYVGVRALEVDIPEWVEVFIGGTGLVDVVGSDLIGKH